MLVPILKFQGLFLGIKDIKIRIARIFRKHKIIVGGFNLQFRLKYAAFARSMTALFIYYHDRQGRVSVFHPSSECGNANQVGIKIFSRIRII